MGLLPYVLGEQDHNMCMDVEHRRWLIQWYIWYLNIKQTGSMNYDFPTLGTKVQIKLEGCFFRPETKFNQ